MSPTLIVIHSVQEAKTSLDQYQEVRADKRNGCSLIQHEQCIAGLPSVANFQKVPCAFFLPWRLAWGGQQESVPEEGPGPVHICSRAGSRKAEPTPCVAC